MNLLHDLLPLLALVAASPAAVDDAVSAEIDVVKQHEEEHCHDERCEGGGGQGGVPIPSIGPRPCVNGRAGRFSCSQVDLWSFVSIEDIGGGAGNDVWGWTDPATGSEYAIMGRNTGTSFVDISVPDQPVYLGDLPGRGIASSWRDIKVYNDHAYIVSESPGHGVQIFDLRRLSRVRQPPVKFSQSARWGGFGNAHNLFIEEETGFAYIVGSNQCAGGLLILDLTRPRNPERVGCFSEDGYTHDIYCHLYHGPDTRYQGRDICYASNEDTLTVIDTTDKASPVMVGRVTYEGVGYTHQAWTTTNHRWLLLGDETDELDGGLGTTTYIYHLRNLERPRLHGRHESPLASIDHNQYVVKRWTYQANYTAGLRILALDRISRGQLCEVAHFDVFPRNNGTSFDGAWSVYPFFESGNVVVSSFEGLAVLRPRIGGRLCSQPGN
ncbi:MAG: choice-of-anchor B family protein [Acidobacteriota bacterium]|nr:choice-of-anchor B family protein [Acidobacteriota bacterium]